MKYLHIRSDGTRVINENSVSPFPFDNTKGEETISIDFMNKWAADYKEEVLKKVAERPSGLFCKK